MPVPNKNGTSYDGTVGRNSDRQSFRCDHQTNVHLLAIGPVVTGVPARCFLIAERLAFEVSASHIIKEELKLNPKPVFILFQQVPRQSWSLCWCSTSSPR